MFHREVKQKNDFCANRGPAEAKTTDSRQMVNAAVGATLATKWQRTSRKAVENTFCPLCFERWGPYIYIYIHRLSRCAAFNDNFEYCSADCCLPLSESEMRQITESERYCSMEVCFQLNEFFGACKKTTRTNRKSIK